ncbi:MAG: hypothetical protein WCJ66_13135 [Verrucomicrobiota bacterium]
MRNLSAAAAISSTNSTLTMPLHALSHPQRQDTMVTTDRRNFTNYGSGLP